MRLVAAPLLFLLLLASTALGDTVTTKAGRDIDCIVLQESGESVTMRVGYGTMTLPVLTDPLTTRPAASGARIPPWSSVLAALVNEPWAARLQQIPATVVDKGVMRHVPYQSYRCGEDYEVNVYGDPDAPAVIEIGIYRGLLKQPKAKDNCINFIAAVLGDQVDAAIVKQLNRAQT